MATPLAPSSLVPSGWDKMVAGLAPAGTEIGKSLTGMAGKLATAYVVLQALEMGGGILGEYMGSKIDPSTGKRILLSGRKMNLAEQGAEAISAASRKELGMLEAEQEEEEERKRFIEVSGLIDKLLGLRLASVEAANPSPSPESELMAQLSASREELQSDPMLPVMAEIQRRQQERIPISPFLAMGLNL